MSLSAVSAEHFASLAYLDVESFPKAVEQAVDYFSLAVIHRGLIDPLPDFGFPQNARQRSLSSSHRSPEALQKPLKPGGNVSIASLTAFKMQIIFFSFRLDLR